MDRIVAEAMGAALWEVRRVRPVEGGKMWRFDLHQDQFLCTCYGEHEYDQDPLDGPCLVPVDHIVADSRTSLMREILRLVNACTLGRILDEQDNGPRDDGSERSFEDRIRWTE